jgi:replicative DNA helicase
MDTISRFDKSATSLTHSCERNFPASIPAERSVLGGVIEDESLLDTLVNEGLKPEHFSLESHQRAFSLLLMMQKTEIPIDAVSLAERLGGKQDDYVLVGSLIHGTVVDAGHILHHAQIIREKFALRKLAHIGKWLEDYSYIESARPDSIVAELNEKLLQLGGQA